jgi:dipeptidyl aminopeptidase/acylaminoacyl peptidase
VVAYSTGVGPGARLWCVAADGTRAPEEVTVAAGAQEPFAGGGPGRLGFLRDLTDTDIYRWQPGSPATPQFSSAAWDLLPDHSPDGRRVVFASGRETRWNETYLADADGSDIVRLTRGPGRALGNGGATWSPDGRSLAFDSEGERTGLTGSDIWVNASIASTPATRLRIGLCGTGKRGPGGTTRWPSSRRTGGSLSA